MHCLSFLIDISDELVKMFVVKPNVFMKSMEVPHGPTMFKIGTGWSRGF